MTDKTLGLIGKSKISPEAEIKEELDSDITYYAESVVYGLSTVRDMGEVQRDWSRLIGLCIAAQVVFRRGDFTPYELAMEYIKKACELYGEDFNERENFIRYKLW